MDDFRQAVGLKSPAKLQEVVPGSLGRDEVACDVAAGVVVDGEQQILFVRRGPPLVDGTVVLIELANSRPPETSVSPRLALRTWNKMGKVVFDVGFDARAGALKAAEPFQLIGYELIVRRVLQGQEPFEEGANIARPCTAMSSPRSAWRHSRSFCAGIPDEARKALSGALRGGRRQLELQGSQH